MNYQNASIVIVDDESMIVDQLQFYLSEIGFKVTGFTDSTQALEILKNKRFDILMTDLKMPNISGMDLVKVIREQQLDTRIIIFTGYATADSAIDAIKYGVYRYVKKPYDLAELGEIVTDAAKMLYLERENALLNRKIKKMFDYMTTLYEVINILYQVQDTNLAIDMVLDTMTEAMKAPRVGLFLPDESKKTFYLANHKGLTSEDTVAMKLSIGDRINGHLVDGEQMLILQPESQQLVLDSGKKFYQGITDNFFLIPLKYQEKVRGFLAIFELEDDDFDMKDKVLLFKILATLFAPIFFTQNLKMLENIPGHTLVDIVEQIIDNKIEAVSQIHATIAIAMLRLVPAPRTESLLSIQTIKDHLQQIIKEVVTEDIEIIWQNFDSIILLKPLANIVDMEIIVTSIQQRLEQLSLPEIPKFPGKLIFAICTYPFDGKAASVLLNELTHRLINQYQALQISEKLES